MDACDFCGEAMKKMGYWAEENVWDMECINEQCPQTDAYCKHCQARLQWDNVNNRFKQCIKEVQKV